MSSGALGRIFVFVHPPVSLELLRTVLTVLSTVELALVAGNLVPVPLPPWTYRRQLMPAASSRVVSIANRASRQSLSAHLFGASDAPTVLTCLRPLVECHTEGAPS